MNVRPLRAIVTDVDGTLTDHDRRLEPTALAAVRRLEKRGVPIVLATGNVLPFALSMHRFLGLSGPIVCENGGMIYRREDGRESIERLADRALALSALRKLRRAGVDARPLSTDRWRETEVGLEPTFSVRRARRVLRGAGVDVVGTGFAIHLIEAGHGKLPALERALAPLGLSLADCLVAGDGDNDIPMLRAAGLGVSFPSGSAGARRAAGVVARASYARGFVEVLKRREVVLSLGPTGRARPDDAGR
jgi:phosphoglycolate phosphatase (TIGR01487 family)